jgi:hypothetical protein
MFTDLLARACAKLILMMDFDQFCLRGADGATIDQ